MTNSRGRVGVTTNTAPTSSTSSHRVDRKEDLELCSNPTAIEKAAQFAKDASGDAVNSFSKITGLAFTQRKFKKQGPNKRYSPDTINWDEEAEIRTSGGATDMGEEKETEIIELHHQLEIQNSTICRILKAATTQTEPVQDEAFDWDLSDKMEVETQTMPSSRTNSIYNGETSIDVAFFLQDAIVQTDQRLAFLLKRSAKNEQRRNSSRRIRLHDAWCQTHIEVQEIGVQVTPSEFDSGDEDTSSSGFSEDSVGKVRVKKRDLTFAQVHAEAEARRQAGAVRPKTFKPTRLSSAAQDMLTDARAIEQLHSVTASFRSQSDAGFQVNLSSDAGIAVAKHTSRRGDISSPVGESLLKSLHFQESLEGINYGEKKNSSGVATAKGRNARTKSNKDIVKVDVAIQTENDIITDVSSTFEAVPSPMRKYELIGDDPNVFADIDAWVVELSKKWYKSLKTVVKRLNSRIIGQSKYKGIEELIKTRAYFRWVAENIVYDKDYLHKDMTTTDILRERRGVCKQFVKIFAEMCDLSGVRVKCLKGFVKGPDYMPGDVFTPGTEEEHAWNAVFVQGTWRLLDCTWAAGSLDTEDVFVPEISEHYFLTDPDEFIFSHFPFDEAEKHYTRWQLLEYPISLNTFSVMPKLTPMFFEYSLRLGQSTDSKALQTNDSLEINIWAWEVVRYKYKFYNASQREDDDFNQFVFCCLKGRQRKNGSFKIAPPEDGTYYLKIYGKPEDEIQDEDDTLDHVATFLIHGVEISTPPMPWPGNDLPWGITEDFVETGAAWVNLSEPIIEMVGEKRHNFTLKTLGGPLLILGHIYDSDGNELVQDKDRDMKYTVLLNRRRPLPLTTTEDDESSLLPYITIKSNEKEAIFTLEPPPKPGFYKIQIFARKRPKKRGRIHIPLVTTILLDYKHCKTSNRDLSYHGSTRNSIGNSRIFSGVSRSTARGTSMTGLPNSPHLMTRSLSHTGQGGGTGVKRPLELHLPDPRQALTPIGQ